ncbi:MAG TPA: TldD/PmbA family protein, partial [bacterium]|nr:TldD/PmbA family protein [bacterium]
ARREKGGPEIDPGGGGDRTFRTSCEIDPRDLSLRDRFDRTVELHRRARAVDPTAVNCRANYTERTGEELFVNRAKTWTQDVLRVRGRVSFYASDGDRTVADWRTRAGTGGLERVTISEDELRETAANARALLHADRIRPGSYEVVADPDVTGTLAHESFGHGVELDMFVKDRARAEQFVNRRVGSELVNILDDPSLPGAYGSYFFDHEGQPAAPTHIVKDGVFLRGISDLMSASRLNVARSANGRRQDFRRKAYARMSNTFFGAGESTLEELIAGVSRGVLLQKFTHGMEDPKGWGITVGSHIGREIVSGKLTGKLFSPVTITGYVPDVLGSVTGVGNDFATTSGSCGKGHKESVPVASGGPHLRFTARLT